MTVLGVVLVANPAKAITAKPAVTEIKEIGFQGNIEQTQRFLNSMAIYSISPM
jgi:hypothetical protein